MTLYGVDVSSHKGTVDWGKVAAAGFTFAINRAILDTRPDTTYAHNTFEARAHGLIPGAYHFLYPSSSVPAAAQCDAFLSVVGNPDGLLIALDVESDGTAQPNFNDVKAWVARFRQFHPDHPLFIYSGGWYWNSSSHPIHNANGSGLGMLWDSHYVTARSPASADNLYHGVDASWWGPRYGGWDHVTVLQFSSSAIVPGVSGNCDVNAYRGTLAQLSALTHGTVTPPDTSTEAPVGLFTDFRSEPAQHGVIKGTGHSIFRLADEHRWPIEEGHDMGTVVHANLIGTLPTWANGDPHVVLFDFNQYGVCVAVIRDVTLTDLPKPAADCTAPVKAAVNAAAHHLDAPIAALIAAQKETLIP